MIYAFEGCELDVERVVFSRDGEARHIEPQVFGVLTVLVRERGRVVTKEELLDEIWGDRFVSESALTTRIKSARQAVGDDGSRQGVIRTVHGRGYEFVADVTELDATVPPSAAEPTAATRAARSALPGQLQGLIGRENLLSELRGELESTRLITLVGPAGVGKTALAYELARTVEGRFPDGVFAVEFVRVVDPDATVEAMATAIDVHVRQGGSLEDSLVDMLRSRRVLLLLDNCEHLVAEIGAVVDRIVRTANDVQVIATSREALAVPGEQVWPVEPLAVAEADELPLHVLLDVPAVALFVARAKAADPRFEVSEDNVDAVVEICRRLDGVPLAIELAAARALAIDVNDIAARLNERFRLLKGVRRGTDPRHQTLQDAVRWSYDLLDEDEQLLFAELSVFSGQFDLEAAEAVCAADDLDVLDVLTRLVERSMLSVRRAGGVGTSYQLLETLREYGRSRLDDDEAVDLFVRHARHYADFAIVTDAGLRGPDEARCLPRAEAAFSDLRAAQRYAIQVDDLDTALTIVCSIREFALRAMRYEALTWADHAVAVGGSTEHPLLGVAKGLQGYGAWVRGEYDLALGLAAAAADEEQRAGVHPSGLVERVQANVLLGTGDIDGGLDATRRQLTVAEASGDPSMVAHGSYMLSVAHGSIGDFDTAIEFAKRARDLGVETGSATDLASGMVAIGFASQDRDAALAAFTESDQLARSVGNRWMSTFARTELHALLLRDATDPADAVAGLADAIDIWFRAGEWSQQWHTLSRCVIGLAAINEPELAAEVIGAIERHSTLGAPPAMSVLRTEVLDTADRLGSKLGSAYDELRNTGAEMPVVDVVHRTRAALLRAARP